MRAALFPLALSLLLAAAPAVSQSQPQIDKRVQTLESQMRAVQRQVFPGGDKRYFPPEIPAEEPQSQQEAPGNPAGPAIIDLTQRVTSLETQQRLLTGQIEELQHRLQQQQTALEQLQQQLAPPEAEPGITAGITDEGAATADTVTAALADAKAPEAAKPAAAKAKTNAELEAEYRRGYALYTAGNYQAAENALEQFATDNPKHARASNALFWAGRSMLAQGRTADAAKAFLSGYQQFPRGERAHNSLLWLAKSLTDLKQPAAACQALDQLQASYPDRITGQFKTDTAAARNGAKCG